MTDGSPVGRPRGAEPVSDEGTLYPIVGRAVVTTHSCHDRSTTPKVTGGNGNVGRAAAKMSAELSRPITTALGSAPITRITRRYRVDQVAQFQGAFVFERLVSVS